MSLKPRELVLLSRAQRALAEAQTIDEVKELRNKAEAVKAYAKTARLGTAIVLDAAVLKLRAERKLGQMLESVKLANSAPGNQRTGKVDRFPDVTGPLYLSDLGITKTESHRTKKLAAVSAKAFEQYVSESISAGQEPTSTGLLRMVRHQAVKPAVRNTEPLKLPGVVSSLDELARDGLTYSTIYADPPWPYSNQGTRAATANHRPAMSITDICNEPLAVVARDNCHLHLWTTNAFLSGGVRGDGGVGLQLPVGFYLGQTHDRHWEVLACSSRVLTARCSRSYYLCR